jgi:hypothetical protein
LSVAVRDLLMVILLVGAFAAAFGYVRACAAMTGRPNAALDEPP